MSMPIVVKNTGQDFEPAPAGPHAARCIDVADLGLVEGQYGTKLKVRIYWVIDEERDDGKPFLVTRTYTQSLNEKASLRLDLESWRGRPFSEKELEGFDLEKLLGVAAFLSIVHRKGERGVFANVASIAPCPKKMQPPAMPRDYVRWHERQDKKNSGSHGYDDDVPPPSDDHAPDHAGDDVAF
jgi:hypothetical protein